MEEPPWGEAPLLPAPWSCSHVTRAGGTREPPESLVPPSPV